VWFWATIVLYSFLAIPVLVGLIGSNARPETLGAIPFSSGLLAVLVPGAYALVGVAVGALSLIIRPPVAEIVFPAPIRRASVVQARVRRAFVRTTGATGVMALLAGLVIGKFFTVPGWLEASRIFAVFAPLVGTMWTGGLLVAYGLNRSKEKTQVLVGLTALGVFLLSVPSVTFLDGNLWDDPLLILLVSLAIPPAKLLLDFPLGAADILAISLGWVLFAALLFLAHEWPYQVYEDFGGRRMGSFEALSRERAPSSELVRRIALRLRARYRDVGSGMWALVGRNLTALLRFPYVVVNGVLVGTVLFVVAPVGVAADAGGIDAAGTVVMLGVIFAVLLQIGSLSPSSEMPQLETIRLLPLRPSQVIGGYLIAGAVLPAAFASAVGLVAGFVASSPLLGLLGFGVVESVALASISWAILAGTFAPPLSVGEMGLRQGGMIFSPWALVIALSISMEGFPLLAVWGDPSTFLIGGIIIGLNGFLAGIALAAAAARFARPPRK